MERKRKSVRHSGSFKPGQSGNPKGRPKETVTVKMLKREFNNNAVEMARTVRKFLEMTPKQFNAAIEASKNTQCTMPMRELMALKFVGEAIKKGSTTKLETLLRIVTGTHGTGVHEVDDSDLESVKLAVNYRQFWQSPEGLTPLDLSPAKLIQFLVHNTDLPRNQMMVLKWVLDHSTKVELSRLEMVERRKVQQFFNAVSKILKNMVGRNDPRLLEDITRAISYEVANLWDIPPIEVNTSTTSDAEYTMLTVAADTVVNKSRKK